MPQRLLESNVFEAALSRMTEVYEAGHRVLVSMSGGKDSTVAFHICLLAAEATGRLPVEAVMRDEEIMFPGTFAYMERVAATRDVDLNWMIANQPVINVFNRRAPYFWTFDPELDPEEWVRQPPDFAERIPEKVIQGMVNRERFPPDDGKELIAVLGLRASESPARRMGIFSSKGYLTTSPNSWGTRYARPIYDWKDGDIWKAIGENEWDYNNAYDVLYRLGVSRNLLRIAPPTLTAASIPNLTIASSAWPKWFDRVIDRLPGVRSAAMYGRRSVTPIRRSGETWEECFWRTCVEEAPGWIATRARIAIRSRTGLHRGHSETPLPQVQTCPRCVPMGSWRAMANAIYMGDPFCLKFNASRTDKAKLSFPYIEPEFFREGAGRWERGRPSF